jgi:site-specific recombinase XerD
MKPTIDLKPMIHRGSEQIGIYFKNDLKLNILTRKEAGGIWSQTMKCWYVPLNRKSFEKLKTVLSEHAILNTSNLKKYLEEKKIKENVPVPAIVRKKAKVNSLQLVSSISPVNKHVLPAMEEMLKLKAFSPSTIRTYINEMVQLLQAIKNIPADELKPEHLKRYLLYCYEKLGLKENTLHSRINAMKFYYEQVLKREKFFWEIPRPKKPYQLPKLISTNKILRGIMTIENLKHKTLLLMAYNAGLRVSEVVHIKITDIDKDRMQLRVEKSKGKKDRVVPLAKAMMLVLAEYMGKYKPGYWLFEGQAKGEAYSKRSAQIVFKEAYKDMGLPADISFHSLRHSYATHLLDNGTDIRFIQELLGHNDIKTTLRYTHVSTRELGKIENPLDTLIRKLSEG